MSMGLGERLVQWIEGQAGWDRPAEAVAGAIEKLLPLGPVKDAVSGTWLGHPVHPLLVAVPIGSWVSASVLDVVGGADEAGAARRLIGLGVVAALPTAVTGASDWSYTRGATNRIGVVHALLNVGAVGVYGLSWRARRRGSHGAGVGLALAGGALVSASGWLGGHLSYRLGLGVDTTIFQVGPEDWTAVVDEADLAGGGPACGEVNGIGVLVARTDGEVRALGNRCTHRGGPLHEGELSDGCVTCPWHGSVFRLDDGSVARGPAVAPQPVFETRVAGDRVEVRRT